MDTTPHSAVAVFDFDGTITRRDSTTAFCLAIVPAWRLGRALARTAPGLALGPTTRAAFKESLMTALFRGVEERRLRDLAAGWATSELPRLVRPAALARLRWHQSEGHRVVLASASLELLVAPWARTVGVGDVLATRLEVRDGRITGRLDGGNCYGPEKVERLRALLGDLGAFELYAYGDGRGDRELLAAARHPAYRTFHRARHGRPSQTSTQR
ncbi:MAG TPA: HAD family hydrolase [Candidatus Eisenbacteria bacterium]|nr:HAD family hydrolase [Candidatus Eisenbacteria bacterium]